jgi:hypothetical protein
MQLPDREASAQTHCLAGRYTLRATAREGVEGTEPLKTANDEVREEGRKVEDLESPIEDAICDRDQVDNKLDDTARLVRNQMLGGGVALEKEELFLSLMPVGVGQYTEATLEEQVAAYGLLISRMESHLPVDHSVRVWAVPKIRELLVEWEAAVAAVNAARHAHDVGKRRLELSIVRWEKTMNVLYAQLVALTGSRKKADRFFRRTRGKKKKKVVTPEPAAEAAEEPAEAADPASDTMD